MEWEDEETGSNGFIAGLILIGILVISGIVVKNLDTSEAKSEVLTETVSLEDNETIESTAIELKLDALMEDLRNEDKIKDKLFKRYSSNVTVDIEADAELPTDTMYSETDVEDIMSSSLKEAKEYYKIK